MPAYTANHLWQSTLFAVAIGLLTLALRQNRAHARHWLWMIASLKFLMPFAVVAAIGSYFTPAVEPSIAVANAVTTVESLSQPFAAPHEAPAPSSRSAFPIAGLLSAVWACGFLAIGSSWARRWMRIRKSVRAASPLPIDIGVPVGVSRGSFEPGVFGIVRPVLLLPEGIAQRLDAAQLQAILAHELCHVRRRDNLAAAIHMVVEAAFWFHPLVWWIGARLVEERERACDEEVLRLGNDPEVYAESILRACRFYLESPLACVSGVTGGGLKKRVEDIMTRRVGHELSFLRKLLLCAMGIAAVAAPLMLGILNPTLGRTQTETPPPRLAFQEASIRPTKTTNGDVTSQILPGGRFVATNLTLQSLIQWAYHVSKFQIVADPGWANSDGYDITAVPEKPATREQVLQMLQTLLADRFHLVVHKDSREFSVYSLVIAKGGPKLRKSGDTDESHTSIRGPLYVGATGRKIIASATMAHLAGNMGGVLSSKVYDHTGLSGLFEFTLEWTQDTGGADAPAGPSLFTALQEQLGLKLEAAKGPVEILVIDRAEKPSDN